MFKYISRVIARFIVSSSNAVSPVVGTHLVPRNTLISPIVASRGRGRAVIHRFPQPSPRAITIIPTRVFSLPNFVRPGGFVLNDRSFFNARYIDLLAGNCFGVATHTTGGFGGPRVRLRTYATTSASLPTLYAVAERLNKLVVGKQNDESLKIAGEIPDSRKLNVRVPVGQRPKSSNDPVPPIKFHNSLARPTNHIVKLKTLLYAPPSFELDRFSFVAGNNETDNSSDSSFHTAVLDTKFFQQLDAIRNSHNEYFTRLTLFLTALCRKGYTNIQIMDIKHVGIVELVVHIPWTFVDSPDTQQVQEMLRYMGVWNFVDMLDISVEPNSKAPQQDEEKEELSNSVDDFLKFLDNEIRERSRRV